MARNGWKLLAYALIASVAYLVGAGFGRGAGFTVFIGLGIGAEILFWFELFRPGRGRALTEQEPPNL